MHRAQTGLKRGIFLVSSLEDGVMCLLHNCAPNMESRRANGRSRRETPAGAETDARRELQRNPFTPPSFAVQCCIVLYHYCTVLYLRYKKTTFFLFFSLLQPQRPKLCGYYAVAASRNREGEGLSGQKRERGGG